MLTTRSRSFSVNGVSGSCGRSISSFRIRDLSIRSLCADAPIIRITTSRVKDCGYIRSSRLPNKADNDGNMAYRFVEKAVETAGTDFSLFSELKIIFTVFQYLNQNNLSQWNKSYARYSLQKEKVSIFNKGGIKRKSGTRFPVTSN